MDLQQMTIAEHEAEINRLSDSVRPIRAEMHKHHQAMEGKLKAMPLIGGAGQVINPGTDWVEFLKQIPPAGLEALRKMLGGK